MKCSDLIIVEAKRQQFICLLQYMQISWATFTSPLSPTPYLSVCTKWVRGVFVCISPRASTHLHSSGLSVRSNRNFFCGKMMAKQQSRLPPGGSLGRSRISRPSATASQLVCSDTTWSGGESASRHTRRLPSIVRTRYLSFHCLNMNPPAAEKNKMHPLLDPQCSSSQNTH